MRIARLFSECASVYRASEFSDFIYFTGAVLTCAPQIARTDRMTNVDSVMSREVQVHTGASKSFFRSKK